MGSFIRDKMREHNNPAEPNAEQIWRSVLKDECRLIRERFHAAIAAVNAADAECGAAIKRETRLEHIQLALEAFQTAIAGLLAIAKQLPPPVPRADA